MTNVFPGCQEMPRTVLGKVAVGRCMEHSSLVCAAGEGVGITGGEWFTTQVHANHPGQPEAKATLCTT